MAQTLLANSFFFKKKDVRIRFIIKSHVSITAGLEAEGDASVEESCSGTSHKTHATLWVSF